MTDKMIDEFELIKKLRQLLKEGKVTIDDLRKFREGTLTEEDIKRLKNTKI